MIKRIYKKLFKAFGPQEWWPGETSFEVMVGAILTQNTNWQNVEKAIRNLRAAGVLDIHKLYRLKKSRLKSLIRPSGFYNVKSLRLGNFLRYLNSEYNNDIRALKRRSVGKLRAELLGISGIGKETADSILLYALGKPVFVVDAYTKRMLERHGLTGKDADYDEVQNIFMGSLDRNVELFNEYHALIVRLGKEYCRSRNPLCGICPLKGI